MAKKLCCLSILSCIFLMSTGRAEIIESGSMSFVPKEAVKCRSSSPTLYVPYSTIEIDVKKTSTPIKPSAEKISTTVRERCVMGPYAPPCERFCDIYSSALTSNSPISVPIRKVVREVYIKKFDVEWFCYRESQELIEVDYLEQKLVEFKVLKEEKVDMSFCRAVIN